MELIRGLLRTSKFIIALCFLSMRGGAQDTTTLKLPLCHGMIQKPDLFLSINEYNGLYIKANKDSAVRSCHKGMVVYLTKEKDGFYSVSVRSEENIVLNYSNLISTALKKGQLIDVGELIGLIGNETALKFSVMKGIQLINPRPHLIY